MRIDIRTSEPYLGLKEMEILFYIPDRSPPRGVPLRFLAPPDEIEVLLDLIDLGCSERGYELSITSEPPPVLRPGNLGNQQAKPQ